MKATFGQAILIPAAERAGYRVRAADPFFQAGEVLRPGKSALVFCGARLSLVDAARAEMARRKELAGRVLRAAGLVLPDELFVPDPEHPPAHTAGLAALKKRRDELSWPVIVKPDQGQAGCGVSLASSWSELSDQIAAMTAGGGALLVQERLIGTEYRVMILDDQVIGGFLREGRDPDQVIFNLARGARAQVCTVPDDVSACARQACQALGLRYGGVDIILTDRQAYVLEVNSAPGLVKLHRQGGDAAILAAQIADAIVQSP